jgi:hypothetical protein
MRTTMNVILPEKVLINARKLLAEFLHCFRDISLIYYELTQYSLFHTVRVPTASNFLK